MGTLKTMFLDLGLTNIQTYTQSGNVVYQYEEINTKKLHNQIKDEL